MATINEIEQREIENSNQRQWFSILMAEIDKIGYGTIDLKLTIKNYKVTNVKKISSDNFQLH